MAKQKYVKVQVNIAVGNRKSQVCDPIEVDDDANTFEGEVNTLLLDVVDAIMSLPTVGGNYTRQDVIDSMCATFELVRA
jgi:hypothetical protein